MGCLVIHFVYYSFLLFYIHYITRSLGKWPSASRHIICITIFMTHAFAIVDAAFYFRDIGTCHYISYGRCTTLVSRLKCIIILWYFLHGTLAFQYYTTSWLYYRESDEGNVATLVSLCILVVVVVVVVDVSEPVADADFPLSGV